MADHEEVDASELLIPPGHVDAHVHLADNTRDDGTPYRRGLEALVANGVTTALELVSVRTLTKVLEEQGEGVGLTVSSLYGLRPNGTIPEEGVVDPDAGAEVDCNQLLDIGREPRTTIPATRRWKRSSTAPSNRGRWASRSFQGTIPLTPEAVKDAIRVSNEESAYVALHVSSTKCGSNLYDFQEARDARRPAPGERMSGPGAHRPRQRLCPGPDHARPR